MGLCVVGISLEAELGKSDALAQLARDLRIERAILGVENLPPEARLCLEVGPSRVLRPTRTNATPNGRRRLEVSADVMRDAAPNELSKHPVIVKALRADGIRSQRLRGS